ncbi:MAG: hypothetical protein Kow0031_27140 [Anaerolineae bacterium]
MPTLQDIINQLQFISFELALVGLFITAGTIIITRDWRLLILALLMQYIVTGLMLSRLVRPDIAVLTVLIGAFICPILFMSARQVSASSATARLAESRSASWGDWLLNLADSLLLVAPDPRQKTAPTGMVFRGFLAALLILVAITLSQSFPLSQFTPAVSTAVYWLGVAGLMILTITEDPLKAGVGLFTLFSGFGLYYVALESSLLLLALWGSINLLVALVIGYLAVVRGANLEEEF